MKKLFFVRHGESEMNVAGIISGQTETYLTANGRHQAKLAGQLLKSTLPQIDLIICSPFIRTYHTAKIIAQEIGYSVSKIEKNALFAERNFGILEKTFAQDFFVDHVYKDLDKVDGAESIAEMQVRAVKAFSYTKSLPQDNILIVSHGSFGRAFRRAVKNLPHSHEYQDEFRIKNAEIIELI